VNAASPPFRLARALFNAVVGDEIRVVRVLGGVARGRRLALDLTLEKAYWLGRYERPLQAYMRDNIRAGDVFFDVGAHVGFFSVCAAALGARVVAVEPDAGNAERLRENARLNGRDITVVEAAVWGESGTVRLVRGPSAKEHVTAPGDGVPSVTVDDLAARHGAPAMIKIDVEGAEARVLDGACSVLQESRPVVVCELHGDEQRTHVAALLAGYDIVELASPYRIAAVRSAR
jgi:FkbM family methyltransferase